MYFYMIVDIGVLRPMLEFYTVGGSVFHVSSFPCGGGEGY